MIKASLISLLGAGIAIGIQGAATAQTNDIEEIPQYKCQKLSGATVIAYDGTILGALVSKYKLDSIFNKNGRHGSAYSRTSVFNPNSTYGSRYSRTSAFNENANQAPRLYKDGEIIGILTLNKFTRNRINPNALASCKFY